MIGSFEQLFSSLLETQVDLEQMAPREAEELLEIVPLDIFIVYAYRVLLHRTPDALGLSHCRRLSEERGSHAAIAAELMAMPEFLARHGHKERRTMPLDAFVRQTYHDVLGRAPDEGGMQTYVRLGRKWRGRQRILRAMRASSEGRRTGGGRLERIAGFRRLLRRRHYDLIPLIGRIHATRRQRELRLLRIELALANLLAEPSDDIMASGFSSHFANRASGTHGAMTEASERTPLDANADEAAVDKWVFDNVLREARRHNASAKGSKS